MRSGLSRSCKRMRQPEATLDFRRRRRWRPTLYRARPNKQKVSSRAHGNGLGMIRISKRFDLRASRSFWFEAAAARSLVRSSAARLDSSSRTTRLPYSCAKVPELPPPPFPSPFETVTQNGTALRPLWVPLLGRHSFRNRYQPSFEPERHLQRSHLLIYLLPPRLSRSRRLAPPVLVVARPDSQILRPFFPSTLPIPILLSVPRRGCRPGRPSS